MKTGTLQLRPFRLAQLIERLQRQSDRISAWLAVLSEELRRIKQIEEAVRELETAEGCLNPQFRVNKASRIFLVNLSSNGLGRICLGRRDLLGLGLWRRFKGL